MDICSKLEAVNDSHVQYVLLRSCFSLLKVMFLMRTTNPSVCLDLWIYFDKIIRDSFSHIVGVGIGDLGWRQAQLPVSKGGLGLRGARDHAAAAFCSSVIFAESYFAEWQKEISLEACVKELSDLTGLPLEKPGLKGVPQKELSNWVDKNSAALLLDKAPSVREKACLGGLALNHSGDYHHLLGSTSRTQSSA